MPITLRGSSWQAQVNHKMQRYRRNFPTKDEARAWEAESKARLLRGEAPDIRRCPSTPECGRARCYPSCSRTA